MRLAAAFCPDAAFDLPGDRGQSDCSAGRRVDRIELWMCSCGAAREPSNSHGNRQQFNDVAESQSFPQPFGSLKRKRQDDTC
jgi:hypothetical protein